MTTRPFRYMKPNRVKDLLGAVLLVLTALLYFEEVAGAHAPGAESTESAVVAER